MPACARRLAALALVLGPLAARADRCADVAAALGGRVADVVCFESADLTTNGAATTPANNSLPGWPAGAFTPVTDRGVISNGTPIAKAVPGVQLEARLADDATGQARFLLRLPDGWNGRLVVAGASGTRSEFNGDLGWSDYVLQKGYAYASQNKGVMNLRFSTAADPVACRLNPDPVFRDFWVHFYDDDPEKPFTEWQARIVQAARLAKDGVRAGYGRPARRTYAVGTSNGGYQVRRAIEEAPDLFDGGVDWEGTFVQPGTSNLLVQLPVAIAQFPAYRDGTGSPTRTPYDPASPAAQAIRAAGYPPDVLQRAANGVVMRSLWENYWTSFWEVTQCQWQKRLDPAYDTYRAGTGAYPASRATSEEVSAELAAFATTGKIKKPLVTVAGTLDALLPVLHHARAYADAVAASRRGHDDHRRPQHRYYEVQNGNHIEAYIPQFPPGVLELLQPHAQRAFDLLVAHVEENAPLPPDQCVPHGGAIAAHPGQPGRCAELYVAPAR
jgi:hypothetical protein